MLKALTGEGILWLTRVCHVAWKFGKTPRDWQTGVIIPIKPFFFYRKIFYQNFFISDSMLSDEPFHVSLCLFQHVRENLP